jgi:AmmeMemoRadiSam system protein A
MSRLSSSDRHTLLDIARRAISAAVLENQILNFPPSSPDLAAPAGAFVTLHLEQRLRGCVGQVESLDPLSETVARSAISAALLDPRFPPVQAAEIQGLEVKISVLSPPEPISPDSIIVGRHGLIVAQGARRGLLLPQVAIEHGWSGERFLEETCSKAGLPRAAWREAASRILAFEAEVFSEECKKALEP